MSGIDNGLSDAENFSMIGQAYLMNGDATSAITCFTKAVELDPTIKDAWVNLGNIYGSAGQYDKALPTFQKAYTLDANYKNAVYGLAATYKNLGRYKESYQYCNEYLQKFGSDDAIQGIISKLYDIATTPQENTKSTPPKVERTVRASTSFVRASKNVASLQAALIVEGYQIGLLRQKSAPNIPEIWIKADDTVNKLFDGIVREYPTDAEPISIYSVLLGFSMYAGIGAVALWNRDWPALKVKGIYESLISDRGIDRMDEYVTELIGYSYSSQEGRQLMHNLQSMMPVVLKAANYRLPNVRPENTQELHDCMVALFYFGGVVEMQRLGMY